MYGVRLLLSVLLVAALPACSAVGDVSPGNAEPRSSDRVASQTPGSDEAGGVEASPKSGQSPGDGSGGEDDEVTPEPAGSDESDDPARGSASIGDPANDGEGTGDAPAYADMTGAGINGRGRRVRLFVEVGDLLPERFPDEGEVMSLEIDLGGKGSSSYSVFADGDDRGWIAYLMHGDDTRELARGFEVEGRRAVFDLSWDAIGGARNLGWTARSSWTRSTLVETEFAFDSIPDNGATRYPRPDNS